MDAATNTTIATPTFMELIERFAALSDPACPAGVQRLGFTPLERDAHRVFADFMTARGLDVRTDAVGNTVAILEGTNTGLPAIGVGSHLDSVYAAGRFDGIAGVVAAMLVADRLTKDIAADPAARPQRPIRFVVFATEEGARFGQAMLGSRLIAGRTTLEDLHRLTDRDGITAYQAMQDSGLDPDALERDPASVLWDAADWDCFLELHIEQGPALADAALPLGIVGLISGSSRFEVEFHGTASHSGGTPMNLRADAFLGAAEFALAAEAIATDSRHFGTRVTTGKVTVEPGSITTIPSLARLSVDVRDIDGARQRETARELIEVARGIGKRRGLGVETRFLSDVAPAFLPARIQQATQTAAKKLGVDYRVMYSGASHDAQIMNSICDAGMIFVPSLNGGVSHSPHELSRAEDLELGTRVLYEAVREVARQTPDSGERR